MMSFQSRMLSKISSSISRRGRRSGDAAQHDHELDNRSIHASSSSSKSSSRTRHTKKGHNDMFHRLHLLNRLPNATNDTKCSTTHDSSSTSSSKLSIDSSKKSSKRSRMFRRDSCSSTCSTSTTNTTITQPYNVSFLEELVTDIQYRPRTTSTEKKQLYYNKNDYAIFQQYMYFENEDLNLYGILEDEIRSMKRIRDETKYELNIWKEKMMDKKKVMSLICREQRQVVNAWLM